MSKEISGLWVGVGGNIDGLAKSFRGATAPIANLVGQIDMVQGKLNSLVSGVFRGIGSALGNKIFDSATGGIDRLFQVVKDGLSKGFNLAVDFEQASVAMETMLGSADKAKKVLSDLTDFAASTPFEMPELVSSTKMLIAFGVAQEKLLPTLGAVGDVASGLNIRIEELAELYGKAKVQGRLMAQDINQLTGRGIPIIKELAKQFKVSESEVKNLVESGKVGFNNLEQAFADMTSEGGQFAGMMAKQSQTVGGLMSTLSDTVGLSLMKIVQTLLEAFNFKEGLKGFIGSLGGASDAVTGFVASAVPKVKSFAMAVISGATSVYNFVSPIFTKIASVISGAMQFVSDLVISGWRTIYDFVTPVVAGIFTAVSTYWQSTLQIVIGVGASIWGFVTASWRAIVDLANSVWSAVVGVWDWGCKLLTGSTISSGTIIQAVWNAVVKGAKQLAEGITLALNITSFAIENWQTLMLYGVSRVGLAIVTFANEVHHLFGTVIPTITQWMANNWKEILYDMFNLSNTIFANLAKNIVNVLMNLPALIKGETSFSDLWTPLTDGFKKTMSELPKIPERQMGALETTLAKQVDILGERIGTGLSDHLRAKQKEAEDAAKSIAKGIQQALNPSPQKIEVPEIKPPAPPDVAPMKLTVDKQDLAVTITPEIKAGKAIRSGSAEAQALRYIPGLASAIAPAVGGANPAAPAAAKVAQPTPSAGMKDFTREVLDRQLDEMKVQTTTLKSIAASVKESPRSPTVVTF